MEQDSASFSMHIPDEQKQPVVNTTYSDPKEWRPSNLVQPTEQPTSQTQIPSVSEVQQEKAIKNIMRSKTALDLSAKRRSTPNIAAATLSSKKASPRSKRITLDSSRQNSSNDVSPSRRYTGSTGKYYENKVDKIFEASVCNTARTTAYNKTASTSTNVSPGRGRSSSPFSETPLKSLHSGGIWIDHEVFIHKLVLAINKKDPRMKSLKSLKLLGQEAEGAHAGAKVG